MKKIGNTIASYLFIGIFLWILIFPKPAWVASYCVEINTYPVKEPAKAIRIEKAVSLAKEYLSIEDTINYKIQFEERIITSDAFNTYKALEPGISRLCWVVTIIAPDTVGAGRTVYVDKENGDILGGYSSK
ncbi:MAG: hypothetical protein V2J65_33365 [Desulfobacteraceae bacterium]|jgi:hypothetical protein|nr:hypothetical protein [Desulfobacteraceae bacterium]